MIVAKALPALYRSTKMNRGVIALGVLFLLVACATPYKGSGIDDDTDDPLDDTSSSSGGSSSGESGSSTSSGGGAASSSSSSGGPAYTISADEQLMFDAVNDVRSQAPADPALNPVLWDEAASLQLRPWAEGCTLDATPRPGGTTTIYGPVGADITPLGLIQHLADGRAYYDLASNTCSQAPAVCEGYTDMVQRGVSRIACVWGAVCPGPVPGNGPNESWRKFACQFAPLPEPSARPY